MMGRPYEYNESNLMQADRTNLTNEYQDKAPSPENYREHTRQQYREQNRMVDSKVHGQSRSFMEQHRSRSRSISNTRKSPDMMDPSKILNFDVFSGKDQKPLYQLGLEKAAQRRQMIEEKEKKEGGPQAMKKNPIYNNVAGKLYTSTVAHDLKQYNAAGRGNGKPPMMTVKAREALLRVEYEHKQ